MPRRAYRTDNRDDAFAEPTEADVAADASSGFSKSRGWPKRDLMAACKLSGKTFDMFRKAARVRGPSHGGLSHIFSTEDVIAIILKCEGGNFTERGTEPAAAWRKMLADAGIQVPVRVNKRR